MPSKQRGKIIVLQLISNPNPEERSKEEIESWLLQQYLDSIDSHKTVRIELVAGPPFADNRYVFLDDYFGKAAAYVWVIESLPEFNHTATSFLIAVLPHEQA
jgi:hypothetical protein